MTWRTSCAIARAKSAFIRALRSTTTRPRLRYLLIYLLIYRRRRYRDHVFAENAVEAAHFVIRIAKLKNTRPLPETKVKPCVCDKK